MDNNNITNNEVNTSNENSPSGISLRLLWDVFRRCWYWMLLAAVVTGGISLWYFNRDFQPKYATKSDFYISNVATTTSLYSSTQIDGAAAMAENITKVIPKNDEFAKTISKILSTGGYSGKITAQTIQTIEENSGNDYDEYVKQIAEQFKLLETAAKERGMEYYSDRTVDYRGIQNMISATSDEAVLTVTISGYDQKLVNSVALIMEDWLPRFCDSINNQPDALSLTHESKTMKVIRYARAAGQINSWKDTLRYPLFIFIFAAVAVYGIFLLMVIMNTTIYSASDIKAISPRYSIIASIDHWTLDSEKKWGKRGQRKADRLGANVDQKLILHDKAPFRIQEAFHELRTNVAFCAAGEPGCTIGVASSIAGSGKSFVISNLAVSLSKMVDKKVLLIDGDMRRPMVHKIFSLQNKIGLSNLLAGMDIGDAELKHSFGQLDVITSGAIPPNPIDLLSSPRLKEFVAQWKTEYDYILFDLPPVGEVADMFAVSDLISGYIFVVRSGYTDSRILRDTTDTILSKNAKIFGYVITDVHPERTEGYTKYGYYYRYSKYGHYHYYKKYENYANTAENGGNSQPDQKQSDQK